VQVTARSQGLPALVQLESIRVIVQDGGLLYLPSIFRSNASSSTTGQAVPTQPAADRYFLPLIGD
jgi:hypothetical protein